MLIERNHDITPVDALTIDRMSPLAGLELMNAEAVREVEGKYVEQFLQDWLAGKLLTTGDILLRADVCGCKLMLDIPLQAAVLSLGGSFQTGPAAARAWPQDSSRNVFADEISY